MDVSDLLDSLNEKQREAVAAPRSNLLVLAGAGSGKTRVLVHRIARLLSVENCSPYSIMAVTFTNKAAAEMRHRIEHLIGTSRGGMWIGTFHGPAHRLLRAHHRSQPAAGFPDPRQRRPAAAAQAHHQGAERRREAVAAASGDVVHQRQERRGPAATARRDLQQSGRGHRCASIRPIRKPAIARGWWISPSCCCARTSCG